MDRVFKSWVMCWTLHFEKSSKNEEKPCSTCVQPISRIDFWLQKPDFRDPVHYYRGTSINFTFWGDFYSLLFFLFCFLVLSWFSLISFRCIKTYVRQLTPPHNKAKVYSFNVTNIFDYYKVDAAGTNREWCGQSTSGFIFFG